MVFLLCDEKMPASMLVSTGVLGRNDFQQRGRAALVAAIHPKADSTRNLKAQEKTGGPRAGGGTAVLAAICAAGDTLSAYESA
jgi:hypothetical protein